MRSHAHARMEQLESRRLLAAGDLDPSLDGDGMLVVPEIHHGGVSFQTPFVLSDGRFVAVVAHPIHPDGRGPHEWVAARFHPTGRLDRTFGRGGLFKLPVETDSLHWHRIYVLPDGRILAHGRPRTAGENTGPTFLRMFFSYGAVDRSFGVNGTVELPGWNPAEKSFDLNFGTIEIVTDSKILFHGGHMVMRLNANGTVDSTFGDDGIVDLSAYEENDSEIIASLATGPDGRLLVSAVWFNDSGRGPRLFMLRDDGSLDESFGDEGIVQMDFHPAEDTHPSDLESVQQVLFQPDGKILGLVSTSYSGGRHVLFRLNPDGRFDRSFGSDGSGRVKFSDNMNQDARIALESGGKILFAGTEVERIDPTGGPEGATKDNYFHLSRVTANGVLDRSFGADGIVTTRFPDQGEPGWDTSEDAYHLFTYPDGRIMVTGIGRTGPLRGVDTRETAHYFIAARYLPDGAVEPLQDPFALLEHDGTLYVEGTERTDEIRLIRDGGSLLVALGSRTASFDLSEIRRIRVSGFGGHDLIRVGGTFSNLRIEGDDGDDTILGGGGSEVLRGGAGNDQVRGGGGRDRLTGDAGSDLLIAGKRASTLVGGDGADTLKGSAQKDQLFGGDDVDQLYGRGGNDKLYGQLGDDLLVGGAGVNLLDGDEGDDTLLGGADRDRIYGFDGGDLLKGRGGNDKLFGGWGKDRLFGNAGNDLLRGDEDGDRLYGNAGDDRLYGNDGNDVLAGGKGIDKAVGGQGLDRGEKDETQTTKPPPSGGAVATSFSLRPLAPANQSNLQWLDDVTGQRSSDPLWLGDRDRESDELLLRSN